MRTFLIPRSRYRIDEVWDTVGLRGSGSNDIVAENVLVPEHRALSFGPVTALQVPGQPFPKRWLESGFVKKAATVEELARLISAPALPAAIGRFNGFARAGVDEDFGRGESVYDRYYGDPTLANPNLAPIEKGPFYAVPVHPGDIGTKGGLVTDGDGRVLREDGAPVTGLYAAGNCSAAVMGETYPGPGATIGPAMAFAWAAVNAIAAQVR
ncbi:FAD-binding protein [Streptomyces sp. G-G2]|uniref:FAD-binding protein n=1 Tax=Streptomyces sp. G-G2 TaxID=3046201 RepID=UPI0024BBB5C4|nr:FAD-binding protein [Streptomyces sp. G-G2]MDJ0384321.1 FAD-binding protein [Streptomyces sp. G-G2]